MSFSPLGFLKEILNQFQWNEHVQVFMYVYPITFAYFMIFVS